LWLRGKAQKRGDKALELVGLSNRESLTHIENVLIINSNGLCIAAANPTCCDSNLLAGLLSALQNIGKEIMGSDIESVSFKESRLYFIKRGDLLFVTQASKTLPEEVVCKITEKIAHTFIKRYKNILSQWSGDLESLKGVEEVLKRWLNKKRLNQFLKDYTSKQAEDLHIFDNKNEDNPLASQTYEQLRNQISMVSG